MVHISSHLGPHASLTKQAPETAETPPPNQPGRIPQPQGVLRSGAGWAPAQRTTDVPASVDLLLHQFMGLYQHP